MAIVDNFRGVGFRLGVENLRLSMYSTYLELTNQDIVQGIKVKLDHLASNWVDELSGVLWAHRTTPKIATGKTPYNLVYGSKVMLLAEVGVDTT